MKCINCEGIMKYFFTKKGFTIEKCPQCKLMAVENVPENLTPYYAEGYFTGDVNLDGYMDYDQDKVVTQKTYEGYLDEITKVCNHGKKITMFEVGCATGFFLERAQERGWEVSGIDLSEYAIEKAKAKGLRVSTGSLDTYTTEEKFDVIVMYDLIEHVKDPVLTLQKAGQMLKEGGLIVITTPDAGSIWARVWGRRWHAFVPPQHLFYFRVSHLKNILKKQGLETIEASHHGKWFTIPYIIRLLYSWTGLTFLSRLATWCSKSALKSKAIPINVRDTLFLIARKGVRYGK